MPIFFPAEILTTNKQSILLTTQMPPGCHLGDWTILTKGVSKVADNMLYKLDLKPPEDVFGLSSFCVVYSISKTALTSFHCHLSMSQEALWTKGRRFWGRNLDRRRLDVVQQCSKLSVGKNCMLFLFLYYLLKICRAICLNLFCIESLFLYIRFLSEFNHWNTQIKAKFLTILDA